MMDLRLYNSSGALPPRRYSSGKTQLEVIQEILDAFEESNVVFFRGMVGSGKSVVGIRTAIEFGGGVVVVPTKVLSKQYAESYEGEKFFLREDGSRVKIGILKGRQNFPCLYARARGWEVSAAGTKIPCRRPLNRKTGEQRLQALKECDHWGFIFPTRKAETIKDCKRMPYSGIKGEWTLCLHGSCPYWKQFESYGLADIVVMNSAKWAAEVAIGRLPSAPITVVDEADEWLDSLALKLTIGENKIERLLERIPDAERKTEIRSDWKGVLAGKLEPIEFAFKLALLLEELDETVSDLYWKLSWSLEHRDHVEVEIRKQGVVYFVPEPSVVLERIMSRVGGKWLLMSATMQRMEVLKEVFGIEPVLVEGETKFPGKLVVQRTWKEFPVTHSRWTRPDFQRRYLDTLGEILRATKKPCFIPVHAFKYLPPGLAERLTGADGRDFVERDGVFFTTKMDRGADLKGMKSIVVLKFPYPEREDPLLKGMKRRLGDQAFWQYYRDMAERGFVQQLGRVLRSDNDVAEFWSPDEVCHRMLPRLWRGAIEVNRGVPY